MNRGLVIDAGAIDRLNWSIPAQQSWLDSATKSEEIKGLSQVERSGFLYLISERAKPDSRLLVIASRNGSPFFDLPVKERLECFQRIIKVALSKLNGSVRPPVDWRLFHSGSLLSFQSNRFSTNIRDRVYLDSNPEGTNHIYVFALVRDERSPLSRECYNDELFADAVLNFEEACEQGRPKRESVDSGQISVALTQQFAISDVTQGIPFSTWRDSKLTSDQLQFFNALFNGPLRLRGAAGTGKTLVLAMRFLKEIYARLDEGTSVRAAFIAHGQETADLIRIYLSHIDERGVLPRLHAEGLVEVTTLHGLANQFVNIDAEDISPISLDGTEGRVLQMELMQSIVTEYRSDLDQLLLATSSFRAGIDGEIVSAERIGFLSDIIDEFSTVLESFGVRDVDQIAEKYLKSPQTGRVLAKSPIDRQIVLELYRRFRKQLADMKVVSLDQFISDFLAYLNSFRWDAVRARRGFDFVFADELHLFNRQERQVFAYLMRDAAAPMRVALAYDPRQSPRNSFLPEDQVTKDSIWLEARLGAGGRRFELSDVFRYTPQILAFLKRLNRHFPADDLSEEWGLVLDKSLMPTGDVPVARRFPGKVLMADTASALAKRIHKRTGERIAVLGLDRDRFAEYAQAGIFKDSFVAVTSRDEIGAIQRFSQRIVLSMPEYVAGLQFDRVILLDANAALVGKLGAGTNGVQRFVSSVYLGASRARTSLSVFADDSEGGFAKSIKDAIECGDLLVE